MKKWKNYLFPIILLCSILLGCILGIILGEKANILKPFGEVFLNLMYTIVVPLVFFTISSSVANMVDMKRLGKILKYVFLVFFITSAIAAILILLVLFLIDPVGKGTIIKDTITNSSSTNIGEQIVAAITVSDFKELFSKDHMLPLIIFSCLFGIATSLIGEKGRGIANGLNALSHIMMKLVTIIMYYAPIGLAAYFASLIGEFGPNLIGSYAKSMVIYYLLCVVYFLVFYTIYTYVAGGKKGVRLFFKHQFPITVTSLATQSSLASLPTNLEQTEKMKVPKDIREVTLPIGATMHMEGSAMAAILKIVFLFSVFNQPFTDLFTISTAILIAVLSAVVMSGIPGGGLIGEMLIVSLYGFPPEAFAIIATIGWLVDPPATCLNVTGDSVSAMLVTRCVEGKDWLKKKEKTKISY